MGPPVSVRDYKYDSSFFRLGTEGKAKTNKEILLHKHTSHRGVNTLEVDAKDTHRGTRQGNVARWFRHPRHISNSTVQEAFRESLTGRVYDYQWRSKRRGARIHAPRHYARCVRGDNDVLPRCEHCGNDADPELLNVFVGYVCCGGLDLSNGTAQRSHVGALIVAPHTKKKTSGYHLVHGPVAARSGGDDDDVVVDHQNHILAELIHHDHNVIVHCDGVLVVVTNVFRQLRRAHGVLAGRYRTRELVSRTPGAVKFAIVSGCVCVAHRTMMTSACRNEKHAQCLVDARVASLATHRTTRVGHGGIAS